MKTYLSLVAAALTGATLLLATAPAQAGPVHVDLSLGLPLPVFVQPGPVYVQPQPVYVQPRQVVVYGNSGYYGYQRPWHEQHWNDRDYHHGDHHDHDDHHGHDHDWH